jgi:hypothetical protein
VEDVNTALAPAGLVLEAGDTLGDNVVLGANGTYLEEGLDIQVTDCVVW